MKRNPETQRAAELRKQRKADRAAGRPWHVEHGDRGLEIVRERTVAEERKHDRAMDRWAKRIDLDADWR